jgi:hypothetical protein
MALALGLKRRTPGRSGGGAHAGLSDRPELRGLV